MKRRLLSIVLCAAMAAAMLTGCGGSKEEASAPAAEETTEAEEVTEEAETEDSQRFEETVTLTYLTWNYADRTASTDAWIEGCMEKFNIEIDMQNAPTTDYEPTFKTKYAADDMPDLFCVHNIYEPNYLAESTETTADLYLELSGLENVAKFNEDALNGKKYQGNIYYVPVSWSACGVVYNKAVFAENNLEVPTNIDEFMNVMDTLKANGVAPLAGSFSDTWSTQVLPFIAVDNYVADKDIMKKFYNAVDNTSTAKWAETEGAAEAIELGKKWIDAGYFTEEPIATDATTAAQMIATGDAAMFITGSWQAAVAKAATDTPEDIGFFALPLNEEGEELYIPAAAPEGMCINAQGENVEAAKIAMNYYLSKEIQELVIADLGGVPTHSEVISDDPFNADVKAAIDANNVVPVGFYTRGSNGYTREAGFALDKELQRVFAGEITGADMCAEMDKINAEAAGK